MRKSLQKTIYLVSALLVLLVLVKCGKDDVVDPFPTTGTSGVDKINTYNGDYKYDVNHSDTEWATAYAGINGVLIGQFNKRGVSIDFDEANPSAGKIEAWVQLSSVNTGEGRDAVGACLQGYLGVIWTGGPGDTIAGGSKDPAFIDAATDTAWFKSVSVEKYGNGYLATGNFTFLGVTKTEKLYFDYLGYLDTGDPPTVRKAGFQGTLTFNSRSDYGLVAGSSYDLTGDAVKLTISCNLTKPI